MAAKEDASRPPDYILKVCGRRVQYRNKVGVAYLNPSGSISLHLDHPFLALRLDPDWYFMLYPNKKENEGDSKD